MDHVTNRKLENHLQLADIVALNKQENNAIRGHRHNVIETIDYRTQSISHETLFTRILPSVLITYPHNDFPISLLNTRL